MNRFAKYALPLAGAALLAAGCGSSRTLPTATGTGGGADQASSSLYDPTGPAGTPGTLGLEGGYPLATGNDWLYGNTVRIHVLDSRGATVGDDATTSRIEHRQTCPVTINGRDYQTEQVAESGTGGASIYWLRLRQDRGGLYEADQTGPDPACPVFRDSILTATDDGTALSDAWRRASAGVSDPARRAAFDRAWGRVLDRMRSVRAAMIPGTPGLRPVPGPAEGELLRLRYPLKPRQRWIIRDAPRFEAFVEDYESLDLAAGRLGGWRIRYLNEFLGPNDEVHVWYGRVGFLKLVVHIEDDVVDDQGIPYGLVITDQTTALEQYHLATGAGGPAVIR